MKGVKSVCSFTKSVFSKSSSTPKMSERVFSTNSESEFQQPPTSEDVIDEDLVGPYLYPSHLGSRGNAFKKKTEEEDDDGSDKDEDGEDDTDKIPADKDGGRNTNGYYPQAWHQRLGPFSGSPLLLPPHPSFGYVSGGATGGNGYEQQGQSSNHEGVCNGCPGCAGCDQCGCSGCAGCDQCGCSGCAGCDQCGCHGCAGCDQCGCSGCKGCSG